MIATRRIVNPVRFTARAFLDYWQATSLFARSRWPLDEVDLAVLERRAPATR